MKKSEPKHMKTLYMVRHAKSSWNFPTLPDHDRPLNNRGERDAPEMGKRLKNKRILPDLLVSSSALRAHTTAKHIATEIGYPIEDIIINRALFHASESGILKMVNEVRNHISSLMLFGHNPGLTWLSNNLGHFYTDNIPTSGIVSFQFDLDSWRGVTPGSGELVFYDYPKNLK